MQYNFRNLFNYEIIKSKRYTRKIGLEIVGRDFLKLIVPFKQRITVADIELIIEKNLPRILDRMSKKEVVNNNVIVLFNKKYAKKIVVNNLLKNIVIEIDEENFLIFTPEKTNTLELIDVKILEWKKKALKKLLEEKVNVFVDIYNFNFDKKVNKINVKQQRSLWGSCSFENNLNFNLKCIEKRIEVIEYLILHELTHTIHKNHSSDFWNFLKNILPNYKELQNELKK